MSRFILKYRTYNFVNKNPVIDKARTILQDEGLYAKSKRRMLHELTGVSVSTFDGWFEGDTRDPRHMTIMATMSALGYEEQFVKTKKLDMDQELEAAAKWREQQERARERSNSKQTRKGRK
ncbi:hypothetical protein [Bradyrhizobium neotropicale]|uniref:hypothetical protein n=1 Tax=Bradyrhizobium neotropicale TaxID=1497615 RepID=UPI001AD70688|nr:hypothetical protein [Bradyrhizobium neotropicale]MBO4221930.1 hypothetical protein [Bradyrhizobium neotropicale]